jgi:hypothetical protein
MSVIILYFILTWIYMIYKRWGRLTKPAPLTFFYARRKMRHENKIKQEETKSIEDKFYAT